jgi:p-hydroxybenzoate 3-monooxygenase
LRARVGIVGAGPAGLVLARLLQLEGIDSIVVESRSREEVEGTIRAGVLEHDTAELLKAIGAGARMEREGAVHRGIRLRFAGRTERIDLAGLTGGKSVTLYPQHDVLKDLVAQRVESGAPLLFSARVTAIEGIDSSHPRIRFERDGALQEIECRFVAGCDGTHGACREAMGGHANTYERTYPFGWLGILCEAPRSSEELIYALHERGFALLSTRSPTVQRLYFQCDPAERVEEWTDDRVWTELRERLASADGWRLREGPILHKAVIAMRSVVTEPMQRGALFLAGDAAHVVPPTGAKGLNLAVADARVLAKAIAASARGDDALLARYSEMCLARVWKAQRFSWSMTAMLHRFPGHDPFRFRVQQAELDYLAHSEAARRVLAENYVGLPMDSWESIAGT